MRLHKKNFFITLINVGVVEEGKEYFVAEDKRYLLRRPFVLK